MYFSRIQEGQKDTEFICKSYSSSPFKLLVAYLKIFHFGSRVKCLNPVQMLPSPPRPMTPPSTGSLEPQQPANRTQCCQHFSSVLSVLTAWHMCKNTAATSLLQQHCLHLKPDKFNTNFWPERQAASDTILWMWHKRPCRIHLRCPTCGPNVPMLTSWSLLYTLSIFKTLLQVNWFQTIKESHNWNKPGNDLI